MDSFSGNDKNRQNDFSSFCLSLISEAAIRVILFPIEQFEDAKRYLVMKQDVAG
jgi:hypothetical protein